ncbi:FKBP-type peptidyl-prolyl cis-trans isomerase [Neiella sp. HB171785]|uniref:Peptidyl-prolyl cis-trans isomerase n=1 Tax=Neiella litorisoli TaxID=2771431 RepID=A0A8J6QUZ0_9GAMM|nr:FKBP-type peptidyl-prolyl cis-trans isomerase [Neiella litorisoli]MBD1389698.1 FKBP-type peptidyl-prolyl cis-trans isomerase [Neiella litorisoli]
MKTTIVTSAALALALILTACSKPVSEEEIEGNLKVSERWLATNQQQPDVQITQHGLQYKVLKSTTGCAIDANKPVTVHYEGRLSVDNQVFDSSYLRDAPSTFSLGGVIKGWQIGVPMMKLGEKWEFYIPPNLAYGTKGSGRVIGPNMALTFTIELIEATCL